MAINPYLPASFTANGVQVDFAFTFPYLNALHVKATINAVPTTAFTFFSANVLRFTVAPPNGAAVVIFRETPGDVLSTVIQPGGPLPVDGLNDNFLQSLYYNQETQFDAANQSTAGLQAQINTATTNANNAVTTANSAVATANSAQSIASGLAGSIATANSNASAAVTTAGLALQRSGGTMTGAITFLSEQPSIGRRNLLINPNFLINERNYVSGTATSIANQYTVDRWRVITSGQNLSWTTSGGVRTATAPAGGIDQIIEGISVVAGTYVINWTGTATCLVDGISRLKGATFTLAGGANVTVRFTGGTVALPQLELGTTPTPPEGRLVGDELALCQRYYSRTRATMQVQATAAAQVWATTVAMPQQMRASPTLANLGAGSEANLTSSNAVATGPSSFRFEIVAAASGVAFATDKIIEANAEL